MVRKNQYKMYWYYIQDSSKKINQIEERLKKKQVKKCLTFSLTIFKK